MDAVEVELRWEDWVVLHQQVRAGERLVDPPWWPEDAPSLAARLGWQGRNEVPLLDGAPLPAEGIHFWAWPLQVRLRPVWVTRAQDTRPLLDRFSLGMAALVGWVSLAVVLFLPEPVEVRLINIPDRICPMLIPELQPGSRGAQAPGEEGVLGSSHGEEHHSRGVPLQEGAPGWLGVRVSPTPIPVPEASRGGLDLLGERAGSSLGLWGAGSGMEGGQKGSSRAGVVAGFGLGRPELPEGPELPSQSWRATPMVQTQEDAYSRISLLTSTDAQEALLRGQPHALPSAGELINAQHYALQRPDLSSGEIVAITVESAPHPWLSGHRLLRIGLVVDAFAANGNLLAAQVRFAPESVLSYRALSAEEPDPGTQSVDPVPLAWDGNPIQGELVVTALYDYLPVPGVGRGALAEVQVRLTAPSGEALLITEEIDATQHQRRASKDMETAISAAALAARLREADWAAGVTWAQIAALGSPEVAALAGRQDQLPAE